MGIPWTKMFEIYRVVSELWPVIEKFLDSPIVKKFLENLNSIDFTDVDLGVWEILKRLLGMAPDEQEEMLASELANLQIKYDNKGFAKESVSVETLTA